MEQAPASAQTWAMLLDPSAARAAIEHVSKLKLQRRICRPLDRRREQKMNPELMEFDAAIEVEPALDEESAEMTTVSGSQERPA